MQFERTLEGNFADPLAERVPLPLRRSFYAFGFPVEIATNSPEVLEAARESWEFFRPEFDRAPIQIRVLVHSDGREPAPEPVFRAQNGQMLIVSDRYNFGCCNFRSRSGWCHIATNMLADRGWFRWFFLDVMVYTLLNQEDVISIHAACVARRRRGVLLCGASGAGKSTLAFACAKAGWTYLADDATILVQGSPKREALGKPFQFRFRPEAVDLFPEIEGHAACIKPNGKPTVEVAITAVPRIATAMRCSIERIAFLNRRRGGRVGARPVAAEEALERLLGELPVFSEEVHRRYRETVATLITAAAYELEYESFADAIPLLARLVDES